MYLYFFAGKAPVRYVIAEVAARIHSACLNLFNGKLIIIYNLQTFYMYLKVHS